MKTIRPGMIAFLMIFGVQSQIGCTVTIPVEASGTVPATSEDSESGANGPQGPVIHKPDLGSVPVSTPPSSPPSEGSSDVEPVVDPGPGIVSEEAPLLIVNVSPENGGINPAFRAYLIQGQVQIGSNPCTAQARKASLVLEKGKDNSIHVVARILNGVPQTRCIQIFAPVYAEVSIRIDGDINIADKVSLRNVEEMGTLRPLKDFLGEVKECEQAACTEEYSPVSCNMSGQTIKGSNLCSAQAAMKKIACEKGLKVNVADFKCRALPVE